MFLREFQVGDGPVGPDTIEQVLAGISGFGRLSIRPRRTLSTRAGSTHWHIKSSSGSGTIEVTLAASGLSVAATMHQNRRGTWAGERFDQFADELQRQLETR
jgi:hypothetical protein